MIGRFLRWWGGELAAVLPAAWRRGAERRQRTLRLVAGDATVTVQRGAGDRFEALGTVPFPAGGDGGEAARERLRPLLGDLDPGRTRVEVRLPPGQALAREVTLPAAAEENLQQVLGFEMERLTPFKRDDVYFSGRLAGRNPATKQVAVRLAVVPRGPVDGVLALLPEWPLVRSADTVRLDEDGDGFTVRFEPPAASRGGAPRLNGVLAVAVLVLLGVAVALPIVRQQRLLEELRVEVKAAREAAGAATALRERLDRMASEMRFIVDRKAARPAMVEVLEAVSMLLPDTTYLTRLQLDGDKLTLHGASVSASSLIEALEASPLLENVQFKSPVTQVGATGRERFQLSAVLAARATP